MKTPVRILHVLAGMNRGGAETLVMNLFRNVDRNKIMYDFILFREEECDYNSEIKQLGGKIFYIPRYCGRNHFKFKKHWRSFFKTHPEYTIIHGHVRSTASIYLKIAKKHSLITIAHSHGVSSGKGLAAIFKNILQKRINNYADHVFACSTEAGRWLFGSRPFYKINNAIDYSEFKYDKNKRNEMRSFLDLDDKIVIGHVGRFHPLKNHSFLLDIFQKMIQVNKNIRLLLIGDGSKKAEIKKRINQLNMTDKVILLGKRSDIPDLFQAMDVFVFPSLYEGLGIVLIEAQAAGLPCIASENVPEEAKITDLVEFMSLNAPPQKWADRILSKLGHERKDTSQAIIESGYDIKKVSKWLQDFYLKLVSIR